MEVVYSLRGLAIYRFDLTLFSILNSSAFVTGNNDFAAAVEAALQASYRPFFLKCITLTLWLTLLYTCVSFQKEYYSGSHLAPLGRQQASFSLGALNQSNGSVQNLDGHKQVQKRPVDDDRFEEGSQ